VRINSSNEWGNTPWNLEVFGFIVDSMDEKRPADSSIAQLKKIQEGTHAMLSKQRAAASYDERIPAPVEESSLSALRLSEIRYRRLFEAARDGVLLVDPKTRKIVDANPFMVELLGYPHEHFLGRELWEIGLIKDQEISREMFRELQEKHYIRYEDLPLKSTDGRAREVEVVANFYEEGQQEIIQCNIREITERKRLEREVAAAHRKNATELEASIRERTAELQETIGELEAFSYSVSHDMRAPLRAMKGFADLLLQKHTAQLDAQGRRYLEKIQVAAGRMDLLIQDVLAYTRVLRGEITVGPVDLDVLVRNSIDTYPQLHADGVEIQIEGVLPKVLGAEANLAQCISNLLSNAVKFVAPDTKPRVRIGAKVIGTDIRLCIEDNGVGIAPNDQQRIFKMFERVNGDKTFEGTGMGLAIVRKAVERMGGQMGVESELGQGSRFWIQMKAANL
jgi:PAS domain S-box-containing protein